MHMTFAAPKFPAHADTSLHGWLHALSRLGLGLDAGLLAMTDDQPVVAGHAPHTPAEPDGLPASAPATH